MEDKENIIDEAILAIWEHPCSAYVQLREKIKSKAEKILKGRIIVPMDIQLQSADTARKKFYWHNYN